MQMLDFMFQQQANPARHSAQLEKRQLQQVAQPQINAFLTLMATILLMTSTQMMMVMAF